MADFSAFEDTPPTSDPAADFLAKQQQQLAGILDDDPSGGFGGAPQQDFGLGFGGAQNQASLFGGDQLSADGDLFSGGGQFGGAEPQAAPAASEGGRKDAYAALRSEMDEPEKMRLWRAAQRDRIAKKDAEEDSRRKELQGSAKQELDDWYKHYQEQLGKTRAANRDTEKMLVAERDEALPNGTNAVQQAAVWERISRLCEFNPKNSKCTKDVSRFRSLLLQLKQTPPIRT